jgi:cyclophilin family peptidyl-prolyl cis-trans isomerase
MNRIIIGVLCIAGAAILAAGCGNSKKKAEQEAAEQARLDSLEQAEMEKKQKEAMATVATLPDEPVFDIITNFGTIKVKLYAKTPKHRENFAKLALSGYYNGLLFHRVINGFMIQGGDPLTKDPSNVEKFGTGGPGYTVPAEFVPEYRHKKGALAAARRGDRANPMKESSGSQFYLVQNEAACAALDGDYTVFGETIEGLDVIDRIAEVQTDQNDRPLTVVRILGIRLDRDALQNNE